MGKIIILDENTANKIAAGEVIEKPASVVKELVENSLDAGADNISIDIRNGGISYIKITDNGSGIDEDDVEIAFERHATSKIRTAEDLASISSMGFRGEALASIAAVSSIQLVTRVKAKPHGIMAEIKGGSVLNVMPAGCPVGTAITIRDLFYNTPARFKFLKKDSTEAGSITEIISRIALGNPHVSFKLTCNGAVVLHTPGNSDQLSAVFSIYGKETAKESYQVSYEDNRIKISGLVGKPEIARSNRNYQSVFINRRFVKSKVIASAVDEAFTTFLMKNKYAFFILNIELNPVLIDVNVHPSKMEVKFSNELDIFRAVYHAVGNALMTQSEIRTVLTGSPKENLFRMNEKKQEKIEYRQQGLSFSKTAGGSGEFPIIRESIQKSEKYMETEKHNETVEYTTGPGNKNVEEKQDRRLLADARIIGQAFSTYIILQQDDELVLIDQHAAHERIMYEELKKSRESRIPTSQMLLSAIVLELTNQEIKFLEEHAGFFGSIGYSYDSFGVNSILLRSVPFKEHDGDIKGIFLDVLDYVMNTGRIDRNFNIDETLYTIACKSAVKANRKLDETEIRSLAQCLSEMDNPYTCPHGRPSAIRFKKSDLEKMFKRIV